MLFEHERCSNVYAFPFTPAQDIIRNSAGDDSMASADVQGGQNDRKRRRADVWHDPRWRHLAPEAIRCLCKQSLKQADNSLRVAPKSRVPLHNK